MKTKSQNLDLNSIIQTEKNIEYELSIHDTKKKQILRIHSQTINKKTAKDRLNCYSPSQRKSEDFNSDKKKISPQCKFKMSPSTGLS